jgi:hypothetical protein
MSYPGQFTKGKSGNPAGRVKGYHSAENEMKRANDAALRNIARQAEQGDLQASIEVVRYNQHRESE